MVWLIAGTALAADCPWGRIETVVTDSAWVRINGDERRVVGPANWQSLETTLYDCGIDDAAEALRRWRASRQATNWSVAIGLGFAGIGFLATPVTVATTTHRRKVLEQTLVPGRMLRAPRPAPVAIPTILCNDGTPSPSCTACDPGCCSWHGGCL